MSQTKILREGYYTCPKCNNLYLIEKPDPDTDGYCDGCQDEDGCFVGLKFVGREKPSD